MENENGTVFEEVCQKISGCNRLVVFTGAGMSAESGIGVFRGDDGFWTGILGKLGLAYFGTPIGWNLTPGLAWRAFHHHFYSPIAKASPNPGHLAIAQLQELVPNLRIITQNVDGLHQKAGSASYRCLEIHGSVSRFKCIYKNHAYNGNPADPNVIPYHPQPICEVEGCGSPIRPDCVLFRESLNEGTWMMAEGAVRDLGDNDVLMIIGTSAHVQPAASLPEIASQNGAMLVEINLQETRFSNLLGYNLLEGKSGEILPKITDRVRQIKQNFTN